MFDKDDAVDWFESESESESEYEPDPEPVPTVVSSSWRCSACGSMQLFAMPSQPVVCECGGLWFETDFAEAIRLH